MKFNFENIKKVVKKGAVLGTGALAVSTAVPEKTEVQTTTQNKNPTEQTGRYAPDARGDTTLITRADSVVVAESYLNIVDTLLKAGYIKLEDEDMEKAPYFYGEFKKIGNRVFWSPGDFSVRTVNADLWNNRQYADKEIKPKGLSYYIIRKNYESKKPLIVTDKLRPIQDAGEYAHPIEMKESLSNPHTTDVYPIYNYQNVVDALKRTEPKPQHPIENIPRMAQSPFKKFKPKTSEVSLMKIKGAPVETKKDNGRIFFQYSPGGKNNYINYGDGIGPQILTQEEADELYIKLRNSGILKILAETGQTNYNGDYIPKAKIPEELKDDKNYFSPEFYEGKEKE